MIIFIFLLALTPSIWGDQRPLLNESERYQKHVVGKAAIYDGMKTKIFNLNLESYFSGDDLEDVWDAVKKECKKARIPQDLLDGLLSIFVDDETEDIETTTTKPLPESQSASPQNQHQDLAITEETIAVTETTTVVPEPLTTVKIPSKDDEHKDYKSFKSRQSKELEPTALPETTSNEEHEGSATKPGYDADDEDSDDEDSDDEISREIEISLSERIKKATESKDVFVPTLASPSTKYLDVDFPPAATTVEAKEVVLESALPTVPGDLIEPESADPTVLGDFVDPQRAEPTPEGKEVEIATNGPPKTKKNLEVELLPADDHKPRLTSRRHKRSAHRTHHRTPASTTYSTKDLIIFLFYPTVFGSDDYNPIYLSNPMKKFFIDIFHLRNDKEGFLEHLLRYVVVEPIAFSSVFRSLTLEVTYPKIITTGKQLEAWDAGALSLSGTVYEYYQMPFNVIASEKDFFSFKKELCHRDHGTMLMCPFSEVCILGHCNPDSVEGCQKNKVYIESDKPYVRNMPYFHLVVSPSNTFTRATLSDGKRKLIRYKIMPNSLTYIKLGPHDEVGFGNMLLDNLTDGKPFYAKQMTYAGKWATPNKPDAKKTSEKREKTFLEEHFVIICVFGGLGALIAGFCCFVDGYNKGREDAFGGGKPYPKKKTQKPAIWKEKRNDLCFA